MVENSVDVVSEAVLVEENAAVRLAHYLDEIGRLGNKTPHDIRLAIQSTVDAKWGRAKIPQFQDVFGVGWAIDLTDRFGGEVLYGIVRSKKGVRRLIEVVDEEKLATMIPRAQNESQPPPEPLLSDHKISQEVLVQAPLSAIERQVFEEQISKSHLRISRLENLRDSLVDDPNGPALIRWMKDAKNLNHGETSIKGGRGFDKEEKKVKVSEVNDEIRQLIDIGIKAENIEVWSRRKQPKVRVELE